MRKFPSSRWSELAIAGEAELRVTQAIAREAMEPGPGFKQGTHIANQRVANRYRPERAYLANRFAHPGGVSFPPLRMAFVFRAITAAREKFPVSGRHFSSNKQSFSFFQIVSIFIFLFLSCTAHNFFLCEYFARGYASGIQISFGRQKFVYGFDNDDFGRRLTAEQSIASAKTRRGL